MYNSRFHFTPNAPYDCTKCKWYREPDENDPDDMKHTCYQGIYMPKWARLYAHNRQCTCDKFIFKTKHFDQAVYDSSEGDDYIKGYCIVVYVTWEQKKLLWLGRIVHEGLFNTYAYIPTDYVSPFEVPYAVAYLIYKTWFEFKIALYKITHRPSKRETTFNLKAKPMYKNPVWFHKGWVLPTYDPNLYNTDAKRYERIKKDSLGVRKLFSPKKIAKWRRAYYMTLPCYAPKSKKDKDCANKNSRNHKICTYCGASNTGKHYADSLGLHRID